jgi:hypothetical protein
MTPAPEHSNEIGTLVSDLARAHQIAAGDLPSLAEGNERTGFWEWGKELLEGLLGKDLLESSHFSQLSASVVETFAGQIHWFVLLTVFVACWILLLKWLQRKSLGWKSVYERPILVSRTQSARDGLEIALRRGDFAEAARWQWRLFLEGRGADAAVTPSEYTQTVPRSERFDAALPEVYRIMFGPGAASEGDFRQFSRLLDESFAEHTPGSTT